MKLITIIGARPQFIKAAVVSRALAEFNRSVNSSLLRISEKIIHTGQHYDDNMSQVFFKELEIPDPEYNLGIDSGDHGEMTGAMLQKIEAVLLAEKPDCVLVYGDTNSTLAGALSAVKLHIPIAHVEAGLRSYNRRMPEEINRLVTDHISDILFCPTRQAVENLKIEGIVSKEKSINPSSKNDNQNRTVALVGDVMLDAVLYNRKYASKPQFKLQREFILATLHRAENTDDPDRLKTIFKAFEIISREIPIILPLHPRTKKKIAGLTSQASRSKLHIVEPVSYHEMIFLLDKCNMVMTDSGGLQK
ncbi:MAG: UDP-N-acetylglucosamine 2-epimerase (non-hydrolyzing), partial [Desulfobacteraceae bacterium]|nr:UDP-N-acetylglucosamine 2-epimerase (non-hydrolyzing) [Desulfobacteraceae bacterium]